MKRKETGTKLYHIIFYLAPGDYHRYHSPYDMIVKNRNHVVGFLKPVKISYVEKHPEVYEGNERVILVGDTP